MFSWTGSPLARAAVDPWAAKPAWARVAGFGCAHLSSTARGPHGRIAMTAILHGGRTRQPLSSCRWPEIALLGIGVNLGVLVAAPIARPDLGLLEKALSYYAVGPWAVLQSLAFGAMAIGSIALGAALSQSQLSSRWGSLAAAGLAVSGVASLGLVAYPMGAPGPTTFIGDAHKTAGTIGAAAQLGAVLALIFAVRTDRRWRPLFRPAVVAFVAAASGAVLTQVKIWWPRLGIPMGAAMRLVVIPLVLLWGAVALRLRQRCLRSLGRSAAAT